jgi:hypothetical protein
MYENPHRLCQVLIKQWFGLTEELWTFPIQGNWGMWVCSSATKLSAKVCVYAKYYLLCPQQSKAPDSPVTRTRSQTVFAADQFPPLDKLAVQIATIDYNFLKRVKLADLYSASWMKQSADKNGMTAWIQNSNLFTRWVATKILRNPSKQARAKVIGKFIKLLDVRPSGAVLVILGRRCV